MPKISIITPIYADVPDKIIWLDEMIQSVISQTVTDWELILIDDGSLLPLDEVKQKHANDMRLRWLRNAQNEGPAKTRNTAVALAESECILPLDSDDMLAGNEVLERMYDVWSMDQTKTIYGNLQIYKPTPDGFERTKVHQLAYYSFEGAMHLEWGLMPVTTMHSKEAHYNAGGWKPELTHGREDLEYWIACGKAGYCGQKINYTTLLYRKHEQSRDYRLKFENRELRTVQEKIKSMHSDVYSGRYPMGCCGEGKQQNQGGNIDPIVTSQKNQTVTKITELDGYEEKDLIWVTYQGGKRGRFDILARGPIGLPSSYTILGTGHSFQVHRAHSKIFSDRQRLGFVVNQPDPRQRQEAQPEPVVTPQPQVIEVPKSPKLSTLVSLDDIGVGTREVEIVSSAIMTDEVIIEPTPPPSYSDTMVINPPQVSLSVDNLKLSDTITRVLKHDNWTVEKLTEATPGELIELPGIGIKRAHAIIKKAQECIKGFGNE